jgi:phosphotransferase system enzyme I (PtsI)
MKRIEGVPISPGIAHAAPRTLHGIRVRPDAREIDGEEVGRELDRFQKAVAATRAELIALRERTAEEIGESEAGIFDAHLLVLEDPLLHLEVSRKLAAEQRNVEAVLLAVIEGLTARFAELNDDIMRERAADIADVGAHIIRHLMGLASEPIAIEEPCVLMATEIPPTIAASFDAEMVLGFVAEIGGPTSHTAIIARALGIPAVVLPPGSIEELRGAALLIVDGRSGVVIADPDEATRADYDERSRSLIEHEILLRRRSGLEAVTSDGRQVAIAANIELPSEIVVAREHGAAGVGLFRTEFLFMNRRHLPDEEEQYRHYRVVAEAFSDAPVVIRTIDIGGDKFLSEIHVPREMNPYLGMRAIRLSLRYPEIFRIQLRAILRASRHGRVKVMFPMISCLDEVSGAMAALADCAAELGIDHDEIEVGIMVETPSAAMTADHLGRFLDFFSIGTNDLIQYTMAAERGNDRLAHLNRATQPAVIRLLERIVAASRAHEIECSVCGETASDLSILPLLVGLGISSLSMNPRRIPAVKEMIRSLSARECEETLAEVRDLPYANAVEERIRARFGERIAEIEADRVGDAR